MLTALMSLVVLTCAQGCVDLSEILAAPLESAFTDAGGASVLKGAFDAHRYAVWLSADAEGIKAIEDTLNAEGFVRGYSRAWSEPVPAQVDVGSSHLQWLSETVEEFGSGDGARMRFDGTRQFTIGESRYEHAIEATIPNSYGAVLDAGYDTEFMVGFLKGNDVYFVWMDSGVNDMTAQVLAQGRSQFDLAPPYTIPPGQWTSPSQPDPSADDKAKVFVNGGILFLILVGRLLLFLFRGRLRRAGLL